jgi:hypothetical protein
MRLLPWMACMQALQEQKPAITMDGMYAGFAGAKACQKKSLFFEVLSTTIIIIILREASD